MILSQVTKRTNLHVQVTVYESVSCLHKLHSSCFMPRMVCLDDLPTQDLHCAVVSKLVKLMYETRM